MIAFSQSLMTQRSLVLDLLYEKLHYKIKTSNKVMVLFDIKNEEFSAQSLICYLKALPLKKVGLLFKELLLLGGVPGHSSSYYVGA